MAKVVVLPVTGISDACPNASWLAEHSTMSSRAMFMSPRPMLQGIVPGDSEYGTCGTVCEHDGVGLTGIEKDRQDDGDREGVGGWIG
jgi:hypothetical protein